MASSKRYRPHTRAEWEQFRPEFTKLYYEERKRLADVVALLQEKGFRAR